MIKFIKVVGVMVAVLISVFSINFRTTNAQTTIPCPGVFVYPGPSVVSLNPCNVSLEMVDGSGNKDFSVIMKDENRGYFGGTGFGVYAPDFPNGGLSHDVASGSFGGSGKINFSFLDNALSSNGLEPRIYDGSVKIILNNGGGIVNDQTLTLNVSVKVYPKGTILDTPCFYFKYDLSVLGIKDSPDIASLQKSLIANGFNITDPSAYFGASTKSALVLYQRSLNLPESGNLDSITREQLNRSCASPVYIAENNSVRIGSPKKKSGIDVSYPITFTFVLKNDTNSDVYISRDPAIVFSKIVTGYTNNINSSSTLSSHSPLRYNFKDGADFWVIPANGVRAFSVYADIKYENNHPGLKTIKISAIKYGTSVSNLTDRLITSRLEDLKASIITSSIPTQVAIPEADPRRTATSTTATSSITILSPNGGELLFAGSTTTIKWNTQNFPANMKVWLTLNDGNGTTFPGSFLNAVVPNTGRYDWYIPRNIVSPSTTGRFKVGASSYDAGPSAYDLSDLYFTISVPPTQVSAIPGVDPRRIITPPLPPPPPPQSSPCYIFSLNLSVGSRGPDVDALIAFLVSKSFLKNETNERIYGEDFTEAVRNAVSSYQRSVGLPDAGFVGPLTRAVMNNDCKTNNGVGPLSTVINILSSSSKYQSILSVIDSRGKEIQLNTFSFPGLANGTYKVNFVNKSDRISLPVSASLDVSGSKYKIYNIKYASQVNTSRVEPYAYTLTIDGKYVKVVTDYTTYGQGQETYYIEFTKNGVVIYPDVIIGSGPYMPSSAGDYVINVYTKKQNTLTKSGNSLYIKVNNDHKSIDINSSSPTPSITLLSPKLGNVLIEGSRHTITWSSVNLPANAKINISIMNGTSGTISDPNTDIVSGLSSTQTSYTWTVKANQGWSIGKETLEQKFADLFGITTVQAVTNQYVIGVSASVPGVYGEIAYGKTAPFTIASYVAPTITSINPSSVKPGERIDVYGTGFEAVDQYPVFIKNRPGEGNNGVLNPSQVIIDSTKQLHFTVPSMPPAIYNLSVVAKNGESNTVSFTVGLASVPTAVVFPTLTGITPSSARFGDIITLYGTNLGNIRNGDQISLSNSKGSISPELVSRSNISLSFRLPNIPYDTYDVMVFDDNDSNKLKLTVLAPVVAAPASTAPTSPTATITSPGNSGIFLTGYNATFTGNAVNGTGKYTYYWNFGDGSSSVLESNDSSTQTTTHVYRDTGQYTVKLYVRDSAGSTSEVKSVTINVYGATIASITPSSARVGALVTLYGTRFEGVDANLVFIFDGKGGQINPSPQDFSVSSSQITFRIPNIAPGNYKVMVIGDMGDSNVVDLYVSGTNTASVIDWLATFFQ